MAEDAVAEPVQVDNAVWKILVVDDEPAIHQVTKLALRNLTVQGRPSQLINALSARDAREQLAKYPDIAVILLDVVMETENAGLDFIKHIRVQAANPLVRIILRTGQPGQAPERQVMVDYDINDYKEKTELTASKLFTTVMSSIRTFGHLQAMQGWQQAVTVLGHLNTDLFGAANDEDMASKLVAQLVQLDLFSAVACWTDLEADEPVLAHGVQAPMEAQRTILHWAMDAPGTLMAQDGLYGVVLVRPGAAELAMSMTARQPLSDEAKHRLGLWLKSVLVVLANRPVKTRLGLLA